MPAAGWAQATPVLIGDCAPAGTVHAHFNGKGCEHQTVTAATRAETSTGAVEADTHGWVTSILNGIVLVRDILQGNLRCKIPDGSSIAVF